MPSGIDGLSPVKLLVDILHGIMERTLVVRDNVHERIALSMARDVAIGCGQLLSTDEMAVLLADLFATSSPSRTPDGELVLYIMDDSDISRNFSR